MERPDYKNISNTLTKQANIINAMKHQDQDIIHMFNRMYAFIIHLEKEMDKLKEKPKKPESEWESCPLCTSELELRECRTRVNKLFYLSCVDDEGRCGLQIGNDLDGFNKEFLITEWGKGVQDKGGDQNDQRG